MSGKILTPDQMKELAAVSSVDSLIKNGMKVGMGTGTTAVYAVRYLGKLLKTGNIKDILVVPTSLQTMIECQNNSIPLRTLNDPDIGGKLDIALDGADEVGPDFSLVKGGGGAHLIEKLVEYAADYFAVFVDSSKIVDSIGTGFPIPVEVIPEARIPAAKTIESLGASVVLRQALKKIGPVITEHGNLLLDIKFPKPIDPEKFERELKLIPGVVEVGLFGGSHIKEVFISKPEGTLERRKK